MCADHMQSCLHTNSSLIVKVVGPAGDCGCPTEEHRGNGEQYICFPHRRLQLRRLAAHVQNKEL